MPAKKIGIVGIPPLAVIKELRERQCSIVDLDEPQVHLGMDVSSQYLPKVYCAILRTVVVNALYIGLDEIYIDVGPGKCDCALHVATILEDILKIPVNRTRNLDSEPFGTPVSRARMPLFEKFMAITRGVLSDSPHLPWSRAGRRPVSGACRPVIFPSSPCFRIPPTSTAGHDAWRTRPRQTRSWKRMSIRPCPRSSLPSRSAPRRRWPITWPGCTPILCTLTATLPPATAPGQK